MTKYITRLVEYIKSCFCITFKILSFLSLHMFYCEISKSHCCCLSFSNFDYVFELDNFEE